MTGEGFTLCDYLLTKQRSKKRENKPAYESEIKNIFFTVTVYQKYLVCIALYFWSHAL